MRTKALAYLLKRSWKTWM